MTEFKVLFTGSRNWFDKLIIFTAFKEIHDKVHASEAYEHVELIHGNCPRGGDFLANECGHDLGWKVTPLSADWDHCAISCPKPVGHRRVKKVNDIDHPGLLEDYCPNAGPRRNLEMVEKKPHLCIACVYGVSYGTSNCIKLAERAGIKVTRYFT